MTIELYNYDCLEKMRELSSNSIDLIICDLPYGCLSTGELCKWDIDIDLSQFWEQIKRIRRSNHSPCIHFTTTKYGYTLIGSNPKEFRYDLVWDKGRGISFLSANKMPMRSHEMIYVFSNKGAYYNRLDISGDFAKWENGGGDRTNQVYVKNCKRVNKSGGDGKRCALSVINSVKQKASYQMKGQHPTEKPVELYKFLIERYCSKDGVVLDPTFGSCNSGIACRELGMSYIGIEMNKEFYDKAISKFAPPG